MGVDMILLDAELSLCSEHHTVQWNGVLFIIPGRETLLMYHFFSSLDNSEICVLKKVLWSEIRGKLCSIM
ncbi:hypothetical protein BRARA_J01272 [Brassica rapa]|uniref:Uncharacterized protein n=1 Tax=Brassica campestris TaxID=3711 RepID=A0A397XK47_BRACM|nr:hypothetical protein BRARA_J01272 [Brassica rapa]